MNLELTQEQAMDINPINSGHCLIITKAHAANLYEAELTDLQAAMEAIMAASKSQGKSHYSPA